MKKTLILCEKPSLKKNFFNNFDFLSFIEKKQIILIYTYTFAGYKFKYPSLKYKEYPIIEEPLYINTSNQNYSEISEDYDELIILTDNDYEGSFAAYKVLMLNDKIDLKKHFKKITIFKTNVLRQDFISSQIKNENFLSYNYFSDRIKGAKIKYYFDYNYNRNAQVFFNEIIKKKKLSKVNISITKNMVLLLWLIKKEDMKSISKILKTLNNYNGTGKYEPFPIGSVASRGLIIRNLIDLEFITENGITKDGELFLSLLVKQTFDPDLPMRIEEWKQMNEEDAYSKIDSYIFSVFTKQKNKNKSLKLNCPIIEKIDKNGCFNFELS